MLTPPAAVGRVDPPAGQVEHVTGAQRELVVRLAPPGLLDLEAVVGPRLVAQR